MKTQHTRKLLVAGVAALLVLGLAAVAWACTVQARIIGLSPSAAPGTEVQLRGEGAPSNVPVAIYWNDTSSPMLAETVSDTAGNFSAAVRVPQATPDIHYLIAVPQGGTAARGPIEVTATASSPSSAGEAERSTDLWRGFAASEGSVSDAPLVTASEGASSGALGIGLLAVGAAGLVSGLGIAVLRRRSTASA